MNNPQWLEPPMSRTIFYGPKDVRAIEVRLYIPRENGYSICIHGDPDQMPRFAASNLGLHCLPVILLGYGGSPDYNG